MTWLPLINPENCDELPVLDQRRPHKCADLPGKILGCHPLRSDAGISGDVVDGGDLAGALLVKQGAAVIRGPVHADARRHRSVGPFALYRRIFLLRVDLGVDDLMAAQLFAEAFACNRDDFERVGQRLDRVGKFEPEGIAFGRLKQPCLQLLLGRYVHGDAVADDRAVRLCLFARPQTRPTHFTVLAAHWNFDCQIGVVARGGFLRGQQHWPVFRQDQRVHRAAVRQRLLDGHAKSLSTPALI